MSKNFKEINFPATYKYSSDSEHIPLEFYNDTFPVAKKIDLFLGYFSSNAIKVLSKSFAEFVVNGGEMRIITNHVYSLKDKENLIDQNSLENEDKIIDIFNDLEKLEFELSDYGQHFFDCLKYLQKNKRLIIQPVKFNNVDLAHCKRMILYDGTDYISTDGSINFTLSALTKNSESFEVNVPWVNEVFEKRVVNERGVFENVLNGQHPDYKHISSEKIEVVINNFGNDKDKQDLLEDSLKIDDSSFGKRVKQILKQKKERFLKKIRLISVTPKFPFPQGPREYQRQAYENWGKDDYKGIFAMATGTGKTITSLNCILEEYKKSNYYKFLVLVPTRALVEQWEKEILQKFNFGNLLSIRDKYFYEDLKYDDKDDNSCILVTYATFKSQKFQKVFNRIKHKNNFTLIADEAHNMGSKGFLNVMNSIEEINKRIGLSATPSRYFDELGEKQVYDFFNTEIIDDIPQFSYSFNIAEAINAKPKKFLCPYKYEIRFVELMSDELKKYRKYTRQLLNYLDKDGNLKKIPEVENILKLRKDIIKKAKNKKKELIDIINQIGVKNFKYAFVYVPEGKEIDYSETDVDWNQSVDQEDSKIIADYTKEINKVFNYKIPIRHFTGETSDRELILNQFSSGKYSALFAMKCLDEGVDVPRTEIAIFCSSTGNPRQYVQRRGRVLRLHNDKKEALIYDMIVIPILENLNDNTKEYNCERNLVTGEIRRLIEFAKDSKSLDDVLLNKELIKVCDFFKINIQEFLN